MEALLNDIADLLQAICRRRGLAYAKINIVLYCGVIPGFFAIFEPLLNILNARHDRTFIPAPTACSR